MAKLDKKNPPKKDKKVDLLPFLTKDKTGFKCGTTNCSEYTTTEYANIIGQKREDIQDEISGDAWYKRAKLIQGGGESIWDGEGELDYTNLQVGDFVSLGDGKQGRNWQQPEKGTRNKEGLAQEDYARHSGIIVGKTKEGVPIVRHNYSGTVYDEPINSISKASKYVPLSVTRAGSASNFINENNKSIAKQNLQYEIETNYKDDIPYDLTGTPAEKLFNDYKKQRKEMAVNYGIRPSELDVIFKDLVGIGQQESNLDNENPSDFKDRLSQAVKGNAPSLITKAGKVGKNVLGYIEDKFSDYEIDDSIKDWERQIMIDKLIGQGMSKEEARDKIFSEYGVNSKTKPITDKSKGIFKQKGASQRWLKDYGHQEISFRDSLRRENWGKGSWDSEDNLLANAIGLYLDNRDAIQKVYPNETDPEFIRKATILSHNAPTKAREKKFTDFYLKGDNNPNIEEFNAGYVTKVDNYRKELFSEFKDGGLTNKNPYHFDKESYRKGISTVESAGGKLLWNRSSTATGQYQHLYNEIKHLPIMKGVTRKMFRDDFALQDSIMNMDIEGRIKDRPGAYRNAEELTKEYQSQLGDKWNYRPDEVAALGHFIGRRGAREYFRSVADGKPYEVSGVNKTPEQYLSEYNTAIGSTAGIQKAKEKVDKYISRKGFMPAPTQKIDNTAVAKRHILEESLFAFGGFTDDPPPGEEEMSSSKPFYPDTKMGGQEDPNAAFSWAGVAPIQNNEGVPTQNISDAKSFVANWVQNPITKEKYQQNQSELQGNPYQNTEQDFEFASTQFDKAKVELKDKIPGWGGRYTQGFNKVEFFGDPSVSTATHEISHSAGDIDIQTTKWANERYGSPLQSLREKHNTGTDTKAAVQKEFNPNGSIATGKKISHGSYIGNKGELWPRVMEARQAMGLVPGQVVDQKTIDKIKADPNLNDFTRYYKDEDLIDMFNNMASTDNEPSGFDMGSMGGGDYSQLSAYGGYTSDPTEVWSNLRKAYDPTFIEEEVDTSSKLQGDYISLEDTEPVKYLKRGGYTDSVIPKKDTTNCGCAGKKLRQAHKMYVAKK